MNTGYQYNALVSHKVNSYPGMGNNKRIPPLPGTNTNLKTKEYGNEQTTKY